MATKGTTVSEASNITASTYREDGTKPIPKVRLNDEQYGLGLQRFIGVCVDIAIVNSNRREIYLARRRSKPLTDWWWMGGGQMVNETKVEAAIRSFERETKIRLTEDRLVYRASPDYFWKDRQQEPQDIGCHMLGHTFTVELSDEEIAGIQLDPNEFEADKGLTPFTGEKLVEEGVYIAALHLYDLVFPPPEMPTYGEVALVTGSTDRRTIREYNFQGSSVQLFTVNTSDLPLGKHAHGKKTETFTILEGGGSVLTCLVDPTGKRTSAVGYCSLTEGSVIELPPFVAHTFYLDPGTKMHCYSSKPYDEKDFIPTPYLVR